MLHISCVVTVRHNPYPIQHSYKSSGIPSHILRHNPLTTTPPQIGFRFGPWLWNPGWYPSISCVWFGMNTCPTIIVTPVKHGECTLRHSYIDGISCHSLYHHIWTTPPPWWGWRFGPWLWKSLTVEHNYCIVWDDGRVCSTWLPSISSENLTVSWSWLVFVLGWSHVPHWVPTLSDMVHTPFNTRTMMVYHDITVWTINLGQLITLDRVQIWTLALNTWLTADHN